MFLLVLASPPPPCRSLLLHLLLRLLFLLLRLLLLRVSISISMIGATATATAKLQNGTALDPRIGIEKAAMEGTLRLCDCGGCMRSRVVIFSCILVGRRKLVPEFLSEVHAQTLVAIRIRTCIRTCIRTRTRIRRGRFKEP